MAKLTEEQMIYIIKNKLMSTLTKDEERQVYNFAFGEEFMKSKDKGEIKTYEER